MEHGEPISYLALEAGVPVFASDGGEVGKVEHVLADEDNDIFDGLVIDVKPGPGGMCFADAEQVDEIYERGVVLKLTSTDAENLPKPEPAPAVMEHHGDEDVEGPLQSKLHRAWDLISGNY